MQPNTIDLTKILKVGDKVWTITGQEGEVLKITTSIMINYDGVLIHLNKFGYDRSNDVRPFIYPSSALEPWPEPCPFEKGELVWVSNNEKDWFFKYFVEKKGNLFACIGDSLHWVFIRKFTDCPLPLKIDVK